jgi:hypothetical protein
VRVAVVCPITQVFHQPRRRVTQMDRHGPRPITTDEAASGIIREVGRVRLGGHGHVHHRIGKCQFAFGRAETFEGFGRVECDPCCTRVGKADVFPGHAHDATRQITWIGTTVEHAAEPVQRGIRRGSANRLVQGRNLVVEGIAALVEATQALRQGSLNESPVDTAHLRSRSGRTDLFDEVEQPPGVAVGKANQARTRIVVEVQVRQDLPANPFEEARHFNHRERVQHVHRSPREQRRIDLERRVFCRRTDKSQQPGLDIRQKSVLLGLVETMHFIDEENRSPAMVSARHFGACHGLTDVLDTGEDRREGNEIGSKGIRHQARQGCLAHPRRPPQDHAVQLPRGECHRQRLSRTEQMFLPDHFGQTSRPQPLGKGCVRRPLGKKVRHPGSRQSAGTARWCVPGQPTAGMLIAVALPFRRGPRLGKPTAPRSIAMTVTVTLRTDERVGPRYRSPIDSQCNAWKWAFSSGR